MCTWIGWARQVVGVAPECFRTGHMPANTPHLTALRNACTPLHDQVFDLHVRAM